MRDIKDLDDAVDEIGDVIRELGRVPECSNRVEELQSVLAYLAKVRLLALKRQDLTDLLDTK